MRIINHFIYQKANSISITKLQDMHVSHLILQLPVPNPLKPYVKPRIKLYLEQHRQTVFQLYLSDQQFYWMRCNLYQMYGRNYRDFFGKTGFAMGGFFNVLWVSVVKPRLTLLKTWIRNYIPYGTNGCNNVRLNRVSKRGTRLKVHFGQVVTNLFTGYPKKYAHGLCFAVHCCGYTLTDFPISIRLPSLALWQSNDCPSASIATLMNMDKYFMWIHYERLNNHNKAKHNKTVCIFLGIYCTSHKLLANGQVDSKHIWCHGFPILPPIC